MRTNYNFGLLCIIVLCFIVMGIFFWMNIQQLNTIADLEYNLSMIEHQLIYGESTYESLLFDVKLARDLMNDDPSWILLDTIYREYQQ